MNHLNIKKIAQEIGVSTQTVSRVINNHPNVSAKTRARVQTVIDQLGYRPSAVARNLIHGRTYTLGIISSDMGLVGPRSFITELHRQVLDKGYIMMPQFVQQDVVSIERAYESLLSQKVDGIIWNVPALIGQPSVLQTQTSVLTSVPSVSLGDVYEGAVQPVQLDQFSGGLHATQHLIEQGYRQIGLITGPTDFLVCTQRQMGWEAALKTAGLSIEAHQITHGDWSAASGERAFYQLLKQFPEVDAVFVFNDQMALGVLLAAHQLGRSVPDTLGLVGFDNFAESAFFWPPLSTIAQPWEQECQMVVERLVALIDGEPESLAAYPDEPLMLEPQLIVRKSSVRNLKS